MESDAQLDDILLSRVTYRHRELPHAEEFSRAEMAIGILINSQIRNINGTYILVSTRPVCDRCMSSCRLSLTSNTAYLKTLWYWSARKLSSVRLPRTYVQIQSIMAN